MMIILAYFLSTKAYVHTYYDVDIIRKSEMVKVFSIYMRMLLTSKLVTDMYIMSK